MNSSLRIIDQIEHLPQMTQLALFGAGETGQEFASMLGSKRPDIQIECFFDSYREGSVYGIPIRHPNHIPKLGSNTHLVITSIFWNEIAEIIDEKYPCSYSILSNEIINSASHLSGYGAFYFNPEEVPSLEARFAKISDRIESKIEKEVFRQLFNLRVLRNEVEFLNFASNVTRANKRNFRVNEKYFSPYSMDGIRYAIEGGVYDGQDTARLLEYLKQSLSFRHLYSFDPFLEPLRNSEYFLSFDPSLCTFIPKCLWESDVNVQFSINAENPSNSSVAKISRQPISPSDTRSCPAVAIDSFIETHCIPVDYIKLDVEGAEMNVLWGAKESIRKWRPRMAISLYHRREHFLEIPEFLLSLHGDYQFNISLNNPTFIDMVLYAY